MAVATSDILGMSDYNSKQQLSDMKKQLVDGYSQSIEREMSKGRDWLNVRDRCWEKMNAYALQQLTGYTRDEQYRFCYSVLGELDKKYFPKEYSDDWYFSVFTGVCRRGLDDVTKVRLFEFMLTEGHEYLNNGSVLNLWKDEAERPCDGKKLRKCLSREEISRLVGYCTEKATGSSNIKYNSGRVELRHPADICKQCAATGAPRSATKSAPKGYAGAARNPAAGNYSGPAGKTARPAAKPAGKTTRKDGWFNRACNYISSSFRQE